MMVFTKKEASYVLLFLLFAVASSGNTQAAPDRVMLPGHVPSVVAGLTPKGRLPATNHLCLAIGLPLRNQAGAG